MPAFMNTIPLKTKVRHTIIQPLLCMTAGILMLATSEYIIANEQFEQIFHKHHAAMLMISPENGQIVAANNAASKFYGYSLSQLESMSIQQINALSPEAIAQERKLATKENRNYFIFRHRLANGELRTVEVSSIPVRYNNMTVLYSIIHDVSALRNTQDALWHYQNRLEQMVDEKVQQLRLHQSQQILGLGVTTLLLILGTTYLLFQLQKRKTAEHLLAQQKQHLDDIIWGTNVGTWEWRPMTGEVIFNERWAEIIGYKLQELEPVSIETWQQRCHKEDLYLSEQLLKKHFNGKLEYYECEVRIRHKAGHWVWVLDRGKVVERDNNSQPLRMSGTRQDISRRKAMQQQLEQQALYDCLTGLPNRVLFYDRASKAIQLEARSHIPFSLLFVDLDGFKTVNDSAGHDAGDAVLIEVARRLSLAVRKSDTVARMGGDEFAIILHATGNNQHISENGDATIDEGTKNGGAKKVADEILHTLSLPYTYKKQRFELSCCIGIASCPVDGTDTDTLLKLSDKAMYQAKHAGKAQIVNVS
ncbi:MAG: diguanylate cyclase [Marinobacterium sp.]|nr:diguanylate cyclase [Marinobacterium sp.]